MGCSGYPKCDYTRPWDSPPVEGVPLGKDPQTDLDITLFKGPFGYYVQLGPNVEGSKPKRAKWPQEVPVPREASDEVLEKALKLLSLPRALGDHPETSKPVEASIGRFGPYVKHDTTFKSIPKNESVYEITLERALELLAQPKQQRGGVAGAAAGRNLGEHPIDLKMISVLDGRYGPYIKHGNINVTIPSDMDPATMTLDDAVDLLAEKAARELAKTGSTASPISLAQQGHAAGRGGGPRRGALPGVPGRGEGRGAGNGGGAAGRGGGGGPRAAAANAGGNRPPAARTQGPRPGGKKAQPNAGKGNGGGGGNAKRPATGGANRGNQPRGQGGPAKPGARRRPG